MSSELLSRVGLQLKDEDLRRIYVHEKTLFYAKAMPTIAMMLFIYPAGLSLGYRLFEFGSVIQHIEVKMPNGRNKKLYEHEWLFEIINGAFFGIFAILCVAHRRHDWLHALVCPALTLYMFYQVSFVDYDPSFLSIQNT